MIKLNHWLRTHKGTVEFFFQELSRPLQVPYEECCFLKLNT